MASKLQKLIDNLLSSKPLYVAELCDEYIKDGGCTIVCDKLSLIDTIHTVDLRGNDIQQIGAQSIVELIQKNKHITTLKLEWNLLGLQNALSVLCEGLLLSSITHLDLRNNKISSDGGRIINELLTNNKTLKHIDLRWNNLGLIGGECILQTLRNNSYNRTLTECLLSGNQIPVQILRSIDAELNKNKEFEYEKSQQSIVSISELQNIENITVEIEESNDYSKNETIATLQTEINDLFAEKTGLQTENEEMKIRFDDLESENTDLKESLHNLENDKDRLVKDITALDSKYESDTTQFQTKIKALEQSIEELSHSRMNDKLEFDKLKDLLNNNHKSECDKLRELKDFETNNLQKTINDSYIEINELKSANNAFRSRVLESEILMERKYIEFEKNIRNECNETLSNKITALEQNIAQIRKSRDDLEFEMKSERSKYSELIESVETERTQYQTWLSEEQKSKSVLKSENRNLTIDLQKYTNVITQKNQQISSLQIGLKETQKSVQSLGGEHQTSMRRVLSEHNRQILLLEKALRESQQRLTISEHRKRNIQLRLVKTEDERQRKIAAVNDAIKCLTNEFIISNHSHSHSYRDSGDNKEKESVMFENKYIMTEEFEVNQSKSVSAKARTPQIFIVSDNVSESGKSAAMTEIEIIEDELKEEKTTVVNQENDESEESNVEVYSIVESIDEYSIAEESIDEYSVDDFQEKIKGEGSAVLSPIISPIISPIKSLQKV